MSKRDNPWKTLSVKDIYDNPWLHVAEHQVINPSGNPGIYGLVKFKNCAVGIIPVDDDGYTWIVGQYRYALDVYSWEIIQGGADPGEDPLVACKRELQEEAGLIARTWRLLSGEIHLSNCISSETGYVYFAEELSQTEASPDGTEVLQTKKVTLDEAVRMAQSGEIERHLSTSFKACSFASRLPVPKI